MDPNLVRGKKSKKGKYEDYEEADEENEDCLPPPLAPVEMLGHRNLLKYRADILKYQGMCLQYQASLLEKEAIQYPAPPSGSPHGFPYQTPARPYDQEYKYISRENPIEQEEVGGRTTGEEREEGEDGPLDLTMKTRHTQSEHMPRIFFSRFTNIKP